MVLLDEVDRADPSIHDILLSILEGQGKDAEGTVAYFSQAVFVMTTNRGKEQVQGRYDAARGKDSRAIIAARFPDEALRRLLIEGVVDETEAVVRQHLTARMTQIRQSIAKIKGDGEAAALRRGGDSGLPRRR